VQTFRPANDSRQVSTSSKVIELLELLDRYVERSCICWSGFTDLWSYRGVGWLGLIRSTPPFAHWDDRTTGCYVLAYNHTSSGFDGYRFSYPRLDKLLCPLPFLPLIGLNKSIDSIFKSWYACPSPRAHDPEDGDPTATSSTSFVFLNRTPPIELFDLHCFLLQKKVG
jgi:hypothetical protein